jgi:hypothetical protein
MSYRILTIVLVIFTVAGCNPGPDKKPGVQALVGTYQLTAESKKFLENKKSYKQIPESKIILRKDGSVKIVGLPDCYVISSGQGNGMFLGGEGKWEVEKRYEEYGISLTIAKGGTLSPSIYDASSILIKHKGPPFILQLGIGDPDSGENITYEKTS